MVNKVVYIYILNYRNPSPPPPERLKNFPYFYDGAFAWLDTPEQASR